VNKSRIGNNMGKMEEVKSIHAIEKSFLFSEIADEMNDDDHIIK
jgi:hypothetical protein